MSRTMELRPGLDITGPDHDGYYELSWDDGEYRYLSAAAMKKLVAFVAEAESVTPAAQAEE